ncbi:MAG: hypothetical protein ABI772_10815 [Bacteroidota bacterium]
MRKHMIHIIRKWTAILLLLFFVSSITNPGIPVIYRFASQKIWEVSHQHKIQNFSPRSNLLGLLNEMHEHNKAKNTIPDISLNTISFSAATLLPLLNCTFSTPETFHVYAMYSSDTETPEHGNITTPPPEFS